MPPSIIPEGYDAYKVLRRTPDGQLQSYLSGQIIRPALTWPALTYPVGRDFQPGTMGRGVPTVWMFVFTTYKQAVDFQDDCTRQEDLEIWRVRVFETDLPLPIYILAPYEVGMYSRTYWRNWDTEAGLQWLERQGIDLTPPPPGTRICSILRLEEKLS